VALTGSVVASAVLPGNKVFTLSTLMLLVITLIGLLLALLLQAPQTAVPETAPAREHAG
jgi:uncharacterized membrane protein affecting hemolysin expression